MKLSVIISNRNDVVNLNITLNSLLESLKSLNCSSEIVVVDNSDKHIFRLIESTFPAFLRHSGIRLFHQEEPSFTSARMRAAREAIGKYIFCVDSHVLFGCHTLQRSVDFMDFHISKPLGFCHPPMRWAKNGLHNIKQSVGITRNGLAYTRWSIRKYTEDRKMFWKFMPWICNRMWYLNKLKGYGSHAEYNISWGGAELLQQIKSWMLGYENWYIHTDPIIHIGPYNQAVYNTGQAVRRTYSKSGNYPEGFGVLLAFYILAGEKDGYEQVNLARPRIERIHKISIDNLWPEVIRLGKAEHEWLMANKKYSYLELVNERPWDSVDDVREDEEEEKEYEAFNNNLEQERYSNAQCYTQQCNRNAKVYRLSERGSCM